MRSALFVDSTVLLLCCLEIWRQPAAAAAGGGSSRTQERQQRIRVAAFASRLEQWFTCRRANQLSDLQAAALLLASGASASAIALSADLSAPAAAAAAEQSGAEQLLHREREQRPALDAKCAAHFDGHLCWPASRLGARVKLACPLLNWSLVGSQQQPQSLMSSPEVRSVINSIQPPLVDNQIIEAPNSTSSQQQSFVASSVGSSRSTSDGQAATPTPTISQPVVAKEAPKFAYRTCGSGGGGDGEGQLKPPTEHKNGGASIITDSIAAQHKQPAKWPTKAADYSECWPASLSLPSPSWSSSRGPSDEQPPSPTTGFDPTDQWIKLDQPEDGRLFERLQEELDRIEGAIDPYADPDLLQQWTLCINNIMLQQQQQQQQPAGESSSEPHSAQPATAAGDLWCPIIFDGWRCWPSTRAADVAYVSCPSNQPGFSAERKAHKICTSNGTWYKHPMTNRYWSNYTTCVDTVDLAFRTKILNLYVIGNLISLVALSASLIIFISFKSLNCTRVTIHKNLFLSFITNNLMWIIWYTCVVNDANLLQSNPIGCQLWHILLHYFLVSNYFWMFCEGLYLHTLLVVAFVSENKILKWFYLLGWLTPIPITVAYAYNRSFDEYYTNFCWMEESPYNLILMAPIGISLLLNLVFLINIVRVLVTKLRANNSPDTHQTRKAVRATLILIPLLGLHYMLTPFRPEAKSEWEVIYEIVAAVCTSFQGLCVAMLFCFCNAEVIAVIKKKLKDTFNLKQRSRYYNNNNNINNNNQHHPMRSRSNTLLAATAAAATTDCSGRFNSIAIPYGGGGGGSGFDLKSPCLASSVVKSNGQQTDLLASNNNNNNNNSRSNGSNSSSLLTTVTASPVYSQDSTTTTTAVTFSVSAAAASAATAAAADPNAAPNGIA